MERPFVLNVGYAQQFFLCNFYSEKEAERLNNYLLATTCRSRNCNDAIFHAIGFL